MTVYAGHEHTHSWCTKLVYSCGHIIVQMIILIRTTNPSCAAKGLSLEGMALSWTGAL